MKISLIKQKILKIFIIISVWIALSGGPVAGNEVSKMLECLTGARDVKIEELNEEGDDTQEPKKRSIK